MLRTLGILLASMAILHSTGTSVFAQQKVDGKTLAQWERQLQDAEWKVRKEAIEALPKFGSKPIPKLIKQLGSAKRGERRRAAQALQQFGPLAKDAIPALKKAQQSQDEVLVKYATRAMVAIDRRGNTPKPIAPVTRDPVNAPAPTPPQSVPTPATGNYAAEIASFNRKDPGIYGGQMVFGPKNENVLWHRIGVPQPILSRLDLKTKREIPSKVLTEPVLSRFVMSEGVAIFMVQKPFGANTSFNFYDIMERKVHSLPTQFGSTDMAMSRAGRYILHSEKIRGADTATKAHNVSLVDVKTNRVLAGQQVLPYSNARILTNGLVHFSPYSGVNPDAQLWNVRKKTVLKLPKGVISADGKVIAQRNGKSVSLLSVPTANELRKLTVDQFSLYGKDSFSAKGDLLAVCAKDKVQVWEVSSGELRGEIPGASPLRATFSNDGTLLACVYKEQVKVYRIGKSK